MSRRIVVNRLVQDELVYELTVRGIAPGNVKDMRRNLAMAMLLEKEDASVDLPDYPYTAAEDLEAVEQKLNQIEIGVSTFAGSQISGGFQKLQTQLSHVLGRIDNITQCEDDEQRNLRSELLARALTLLSTLKHEADEYEKSRRRAPPQADILEDVPQFENLEINRRSTVNNTNGGRNQFGPVPGVGNGGGSYGKTILPSKWGLQFSGEAKGISLSSFLEKVEEYRVSRCVTKEMLLSSGIDLFSGRAYQFYLCYRDEVGSWDEFVALLREEYLTADYNEKLFEEIRNRTQGSDESIGIYLAVMTGYFKRLTCPVSEETKMKILLRNIAPYYQSQLGLADIRSVNELLMLGRKLELRKAAIENYHPPTRKVNCLEPDLAYVATSEDPISAVSSSAIPSSSQGMLCFKCNQPGHKAIGCLSSTSKKFCFRCKKDGYTIKTCPECKKSSKQGNGLRRV